jgi:hypothetical protein
VVGEIDFYANDGSTGGTGVKASVRAFANDATGNNIALAFATSDGTSLATDRMVITGQGSVGIGIATPDGLLTLASAVPLLYWNETDQALDEKKWRFGVQGKVLSLQTTNDAVSAAANAYQIVRGTGTAVDTQIFSTGGSERMRIDSSGNLLVATTSASTGNAGNGFVVSSGGDLISRRISGAGRTHVTFVNGGVTVGTIQTSTTATTYNTSSTSGLTGVDANTIAFQTNSAERMRIDSAGSIFIGASASAGSTVTGVAPGTQIVGTGGSEGVVNNKSAFGVYNFFNAGGASSYIFFKSRSGTPGVFASVANADNLGLTRYFADDGTNFIEAARISAAVDGTPGTNDMPGRLVFSTTADGASSVTERMRITNSGNVGIGLTAPAYRLHVGGRITSQTSTSDWAFLNDASGGAVRGGLWVGSGGDIGVANSTVANGWFAGASTTYAITNFAERMRITSAGLVGIGTSAPVTPLVVIQPGSAYTSQATFGGTIQIAAGPASLQAGGGLEFLTSTFANGYGWKMSSIDSAGVHLVFGNRSDSASWTERMRIDSSGNVGIGTASPGARLDVSGDALVNGLTVGRGAGSVASNTVVGSGALPVNTTGTSNTAVGGETLEANTTGALNTAIGRQALEANINGNANTAVGSSALRLNTAGPSNTAVGHGALFFNTGGGNTAIGEGAGDQLTTGNSNTIIGRIGGTAGLSGTIIIGAGTTERLRIDSSGNMGLGTSAPNVPLQINATIPQIQFTNPTTGTTSDDGAHLYVSGSDFWLVNKEAAATIFATNNSERARIDSSGNLLVATTTTSSSSTLDGFFIAGANSSLFSRRTSGAAQVHLTVINGGTTVGSIVSSTTATTYNTSSDYRLKQIDGPIANSGAYIDALKPVQGSWKADGSRFIGLIAHEVQEVSETPIATGEKDGEEMQAMDYSAPEIIANLIAEIQSLRARVAQLEGN